MPVPVSVVPFDFASCHLTSSLLVQVMELKAIRQRYLRGWAAIDFAAAVPWDLVMLACGDAWVGKLQVPEHRHHSNMSSCHLISRCRAEVANGQQQG